jgi:hypothetical protein
MMRLLVSALALALMTGGALAQAAPVEGNWACTADIDGTRAGILTVFAGSYGYASANFGSQASGTGSVTMHTDGVTFLDGNLLANAGVMVGLLTFDDQGRDTMVLQTSEKPILTCHPLL